MTYHNMPKLVTISIALLCLAFSSMAFASAGKVMFSLGQVEIVKTDGTKASAKRGTIVNNGDAIVTGKRGQAQVRMDDGGLIAVRPSSRFVIDNFKYTGDTASDKSIFKLVKGSFRSITGAVGEANKAAYQVKTPIATIGIRGTDYTATLCAGDCGDKADGLYVGVMSGGISVSNQTSTLDVNPGETGYVADEYTAGTLDIDTGDLLFAEQSIDTQSTDLLDPELAQMPGVIVSGNSAPKLVREYSISSNQLTNQNTTTGVRWGAWSTGEVISYTTADGTKGTTSGDTHMILGRLDPDAALPITGTATYSSYIGGSTTPTSTDAEFNTAGNNLTSANLTVDFGQRTVVASVEVYMESVNGDHASISAQSETMGLSTDGSFSGAVDSLSSSVLSSSTDIGISGATTGNFAGGLAGGSSASGAPEGAYLGYNIQQDIGAANFNFGSTAGADNNLDSSGVTDMQLN